VIYSSPPRAGFLRPLKADMQDSTVAAPIAKVVSAWALFGITSWSDAAAAAALVYTLLLIGEWCWKKITAWRDK
jgi:hypothetical protein